MSTEQTIDIDVPVTTSEREMMDTIECQHRHCGREVYEYATIDVVAGEITRRNNSNVRIAGVEDGINKPEIQKWCLQCANDEFGITDEAGERAITEDNEWLTIPAVVGFILGSLMMLVVMSVLLV